MKRKGLRRQAASFHTNIQGQVFKMILHLYLNIFFTSLCSFFLTTQSSAEITAAHI